MVTPLRSELAKIAAEMPEFRRLLIPVIKAARQTSELIRMKYQDLGDFGGTDPIREAWVFEVKGPYEAMQALIPTLKKYSFRWDGQQKLWRLDAYLYSRMSPKRDSQYSAGRRNQQAAYPIIKKMVDEYNAQAVQKNRDLGGPTNIKNLMRGVQQTERLTARFVSYGIEVKHDFDSYATSEPVVWVLGHTYEIRDVMKRYGFRWGRGKFGQGWWIAASEYLLIVKTWAGEAFKKLPDNTPDPDTAGAPFTDMRRDVLFRWIKDHGIVEEDMAFNEGYDGEVSDQDVLRRYLRDMPQWEPKRQREVFNRGSLFPPHQKPWHGSSRG